MSLKDRVEIIQRRFIYDPLRGWFLKTLTGTENNLPNFTGEIYLTCAIPNESKGGHYHDIAQEWFTLIKGNATLMLYDMDTQERLDIVMNCNNPQTIFIPTRVSHTIINNSSTEEFILLAYTDLHYTPNDTISHKIY